ncbi:MAG: 4-hydroxy-tetrahydrodipicolinate reductase [Bacteroidetes bacterium]|uniref:4-hydroxy-tetrahydrodipicolinate reductase n=1 Tax=Candidatus Cryptobacteroides intestinigallinarum TaxID=2840767 RepID=A0A9D9HKS9_9BACT|nr:4-hydroxy-tetrahydrodipicolinate reductase [Candidatus Cryptobacteroides intestinigallinarum]
MKAVISGYGKMGRMVEKILSERGLECAGKSEDIQHFDKTLAKECVCIDFSVPAAFRENYRFIAENFKAAVIGTTGWTDIRDEVISYFRQCGTPMIYASNFSVGVNVFFAAADYVSSMLGKAGGYSPYILEMHHCHKLDAPSGTAKSLEAIVDRNMDTKADVQAVRCGEIPGIHTVGFEGHVDRITLRHEAFSREGFASGAVDAALMTEGLEGVHEFRDLLYKKILG